MKKVYAALSGLVAISTIVGGVFFVLDDRYASAQSAKDNKVIAKTALQQAMENRVDAQEQRVINHEYQIDIRGTTPDRVRRLREIRAKLKKYIEAKDRAYK